MAHFGGLILAVLIVVASPLRASAAEEPAHEADSHAAAHDHIGLANPGPNVEKPQDFKSDLAIFTLVVFILLLLILRKFAWGPIITSLERREQTIADHIAQAERNHEQAKALLAQYDQKLAAAAGEVREMMDEARRDAEHAKQEILAGAKAAAEAERARALHDIDAARDAAIESLARRSAELAVDLAGKILQARLSSADHERLIEEAVSKFPATTASAN